MLELIMVAVGGALGAVCRFLLTRNLGAVTERFPIGTLSANLVGCLLIGVVAGLSAEALPKPLRTGIVAGCLGGLTTFSTFSLDTLTLFERGALGLAGLNLGLNLVLGLAASGVGLALARAF